MNKKFISAALAALMIASTAAVSAAAEEVTAEAAGAQATVETTGDATGTIKFDPGNWNSNKIQFYIWDETAEPHLHLTKDGWQEDDPWGSNKKIGGTKLDDGTFESFEFTIPDGHDVFVIFNDPDKGQTFDCVLTADAFGDTAERTGEICENPVDSEKTAEAVRFRETGLTSKLCITSSGKVQGETITPNMDPALEVANFVLGYLGKTEKISGEMIVTEDSVANAISAFGTDANAVWEKYQTLSDKENYNADEAKKVIKPTEEEKKDDNSSKSDDDDNTSSNNSSKSSSTTSTTSTTTKTTTTTTTGTTSTTTASTEAAAATGDTTNTAAFAVVFLAAAAAMFFARKKVDE